MAEAALISRFEQLVKQIAEVSKKYNKTVVFSPTSLSHLSTLTL